MDGYLQNSHLVYPALQKADRLKGYIGLFQTAVNLLVLRGKWKIKVVNQDMTGIQLADHNIDTVKSISCEKPGATGSNKFGAKHQRTGNHGNDNDNDKKENNGAAHHFPIRPLL